MPDTDNSAGSISGIIIDHRTNEFLSDVKVIWYDNAILDSTTTDASGYYALNISAPGEYLFTFIKDEYATLYRTVETPLAGYNTITNQPILDPEPLVIENVELISLNAK